MAIIAQMPASALNPAAQDFVPAHFLETEDFSPEWWSLVKVDSAFREYWLRERFVADEAEEDELSIEDLDELSVIEEYLDWEEGLDSEMEDYEDDEFLGGWSALDEALISPESGPASPELVQ
eukprot:TRINITY_DN35603_c0_g1_i1.p2 TRINITY_DN35603_c0_g1~~TRINITY_DN35603_c0_g1_i1.p2  ORF type:complete len:122 (-),score=25.67 TRINITY_DN35603_c0_g1_i1:1524-1889(-)